jgi:hypothetical protein
MVVVGRKVWERTQAMQHGPSVKALGAAGYQCSRVGRVV